MLSYMRPRLAVRLSIGVGIVTLTADVVAAHGGISGAQPERLQVPGWLFLLTGGGVVAVSFLLASFVTDRALLESLHSRRRIIDKPETALRWLGGAIGIIGLVAVLLSGLLGPREPLQNPAVLLVWGGWWAGYAITVYAVGNSWHAINPFRTLAAPFAAARRTYPDGIGMWPSVIGLFGLVWLEVVSPLGDDPRFLSAITVLYLAVTLAGASLLGREVWFSRVDPIANVFRQFGKLAPFQRTDEGIGLALPGSTLVGEPAEDGSEVGFIIALLWVTTYDGLVRTPLWETSATVIVGSGIPAWLLYMLVLGAGFAIFAATFLFAARAARRLAPTYQSSGELARLFAPALLAIAAGYHFAHYAGFFVQLWPALVQSLVVPFQQASPAIFNLPAWFGGLASGAILVGHLLAVWVAHGTAFERFPSRLQAIRSQYPITLVMVLYTMLSLWIVTQPVTEPVHL